jgi:hypothetical protein
MDVVMDCDLLVLCEYEFIHLHCTSWISQLWKKLKKKKLNLINMFALCITPYTKNKIKYIIYHLSSLFI